MPFDKNEDSIAITVPKFTLKKSEESIWKGAYNEPYIVSVAVDEQGKATPALNFNYMPFPKVRKGQTVRMLGDGHLLYGPQNPGDFAAISILIMEADRDMREVGEQIEGIVESKAVELGMGAIIASNPGSAPVLGILKELIQFVSGALKNNKDDELYRLGGTFLRDGEVPYHINRLYDWGNDYVDVSVKVIPLEKSNKQGAAIKQIELPSS